MSGIPGGYRLVSTYNLLVVQFGGVNQSKIWSSEILSFSFGGGGTGVNFGDLKFEVFQLGGGKQE